MDRNFKSITSRDWAKIEKGCKESESRPPSWKLLKAPDLHPGIRAYACFTVKRSGAVYVEDSFENFTSNRGESAVSICLRVDSVFGFLFEVEGSCKEQTLKLRCDLEGDGYQFGGSCGPGSFALPDDNGITHGGFFVYALADESAAQGGERVEGRLTSARGPGDPSPRDTSFKIYLTD